MNSLVSETKVVCNESIPNPITPIPIPIPIKLPTEDTTKSITILNGALIKVKKSKIENDIDISEDNSESGKSDSAKDTSPMESSLESKLSPSEPMDCNSSPGISPAHVPKRKDAAGGGETLVRITKFL